MKRTKLLTAVLAGAFAMCPMMALAVDVPEVSREEYRYYLEDYAWDTVGRDEYAYYSDDELKAMISEAVKAEILDQMLQQGMGIDTDDSGYMQLVQRELMLDFDYTLDELRQYTDAELEQLLARHYIDEERLFIKNMLYKYYDTDLNTEPYSMLELLKIYYQVDLKTDHNIEESFDNMTSSEVTDHYDSLILIDALQAVHGTEIDYSTYSVEELRDLRKRDINIESLQVEYGVTEDLSVYSAKEIEILHDKYQAAKFIKLFHNVDVDVESHTLTELKSLRGRLDAEKSLRNMGIIKDLSRYNDEEVERLYLEELWMRNIGDGRDLSVYTTEELDDLYYGVLTARATADLMELRAKINAEEATDRAEKAKKLRIRINGELIYLPEAEAQYTPIGYAYISEAPVMMINDRAFLPYEVMFEALGAEAVLDENTDTITAEKNGVRAVFDKVSGKVVMTDTYTYVQLRSAAEAFGATATWTAVPHEINIRY
ncbi:MAG: hypothetical protein II211_05410 [Peptococcaceae bacterium]|nr:hypothetical protein [Peptococcaceae bacterium]